MKDFHNKIAVVTGAGSGIGRATALALAEQGARVVVTDLQEVSAKETAESIRATGQDAYAFKLDVAELDDIRQVAEQVTQSIGAPSILINNAGIAVGARFLDASLESWQKIISINLMGVVHCCRAFVPAMVESGQGGQVVNIASMLGYTPAQGVSAYCTTKYGVVGFSECLRAELAAQNIGVSAICPGLIRTNIISSGVLESSEDDVEEKRREIETVYQKRNYPPERVAKVIVKAIRRNRAIVPVTAEAWLSYYLKRWVPGLVRWTASRVDI